MRTLAIVRTHGELDIPVAGVYAIDPAHTSVEFVARHLGISKVRGRFRDVSGLITITEVPEDSHVEVEIGTASVDTGIDDRDQHLRSGDFFNVEEHPRMVFSSTSVEAGASGSWQITGDLTITGVTRPVTLQAHFEGSSTSLGDARIAFSAHGEIDRTDWGLTWNQVVDTGSVVVSKKVRMELNLEAVAVS
jgi:polyisoprenoid-binding protein YceI